MLKVKRNGKWIDICGGAPSTDSRVGSLFTGATIPLTFKGNTNVYENEYTYSSGQNITITGLDSVATITGNGSTNVVVKFDVTGSEDKIVPFLISIGDVDFQGRFFYYGKEVASGNCLAVCSLIAPDVGEVGELGVNYDIVESVSYPLFATNTSAWNGYYSHQIIAFIFANKSTAINNNFLAYCYAFNQPLILPSGLTSTNNNFLAYCYAFNQPLILPSGLTSIGNGFLTYCSSFNQPLILPSGLTSIDYSFLAYCYAFNQPLILPSGLTSIDYNFLYRCYAFNQLLILPSGLTSTNNNFLYQCYAFNQPLTLPSGLTSIGNSFLAYCYAFNQLLILPSGLTSIGNSFLSDCYGFNQPLTIPSGVTSIGSSFLADCYSLTKLEYNTSAYPTDNNSLSQDRNTKTSSTGTGIKITGTNAYKLKSALRNRISSPFRKLV